MSLSSAERCLAAARDFPFMPGRSAGPPGPHLKGEVKEQVIFYGGTFASWHPGHRACVDLCPAGPLVVVPDNNPFKGPRQKDPWEFFQELCRALEDTPHSVYPGFLADVRPTPTADWLPRVSVPRKGLLMGDDCFLSLESWKHPQTLVRALRWIYVVPRGGEPALLRERAARWQKVNTRLEVVFLPHHPWEDVSSSKGSS